MVNGFTAEETTFCGNSGYTVKQYHDGAVVLSQFVESSAYDDFCAWIGTQPIILEGDEKA